MIREALEKVKEWGEAAASPKEIDFQGRRALLYPGKEPTFLKPALVEPLALSTLTSLVAYIAEEPDRYHELERNQNDPDGLPRLLMVAPAQVVLETVVLRPYAVRERFVVAAPVVPHHRFGAELEQEEFIIYLRTCFEQDETTAALLRLVGSLRQAAVRTLEDDGISQLVTTSRGVQRVGTEVVPNPVTLRPYRTFPEIQQPAGQFLLRLSGGDEDDLPGIALHQVEDRLWQVEATQTIAGWIRQELELRKVVDRVVILA